MISVRFALYRREILTANQRLHWRARAERTAALRLLALTTWRRHPDWTPDAPLLERAHAVAHITWPDNRRRDAHNLMPTLKALIDGAVDAGVLPDDDDRHLTGPDLRVCPERCAVGYVMVRIELHAVSDALEGPQGATDAPSGARVGPADSGPFANV